MTDVDDVPPLVDAATKRLIDLALLLQSSKRGFTRKEIMARVEGYSEDSSEQALARKFERDKNSLLAVGVLVEGYQADPLDPESYRYRVVPERALLPALEFNEGELRALHAALASWRAESALPEAKAARLKLEGLGVELPAHGSGVELSASADLDLLMSAVAERRVIKFDYLKPGEESPSLRVLEPWGVACRGGSYFVYGRDRDRADVRVFNLARVSGAFRPLGRENAFETPEAIDVDSLIDPKTPSELQTSVRLRLEEGKGGYWRLRIGTEESLSQRAGEFEFELTNPYSMLPQLAADSPGVVVLEPAHIRALVARMVGAAHEPA